MNDSTSSVIIIITAVISNVLKKKRKEIDFESSIYIKAMFPPIFFHSSFMLGYMKICLRKCDIVKSESGSRNAENPCVNALKFPFHYSRERVEKRLMIFNVSHYHRTEHLRHLFKFHFGNITFALLSTWKVSSLFTEIKKSFRKTNATLLANKKALPTHGPRVKSSLSFSLFICRR